MRAILRVVATALVGVLAGPVCLILANTWRPEVSLGLLRDLPPIASGFYPVERLGHEAWVWTRDTAEVRLAGLDRRVGWACTVRFRGGRADPSTQPDLELAVDGVTAAVRRATNDYQLIEVGAPPRAGRSGLVLTLRSSATMVPGGGDRRTLGVQVSHLACRPVGVTIVRPPGPAMGSAAVAGAVFGAAFGAASATLAAAAGATVLLSAAVAAVLAVGAGLFGPFPATTGRLAAWMAALAVLSLVALRLAGRRPTSPASRFVVAFLAAAIFLKLIALLHPAKPIVDAVFHAHRFDGVLAGRLYFTQPSTSGTPFPYAIGLYLFAALWSPVTSDHVTLLRVVVVAADAVASALLYVVIVRLWHDRLAGVFAVALSALVPLWYLVVGNANLTNAFGQSVSTVTVVTAVIWAGRRPSAGPLVGLTLLTTLGLICHVSTFVLLLTTMLAIGAIYRWKGGTALRPAARSVLLATLAATLLSIVFYWGHFGTLYAARLDGVRAAVSARLAGTGEATTAADTRGAAAATTPELGRSFIPVHRRTIDALRQTVVNLGWPLIGLVALGVWRLYRDRSVPGRPADPLALALAAVGVTFVLFLTFAVVSAVDRRYQQDAWEFIGRVQLSAYPAAAVVAARGAAWAWRAGLAARCGAGGLLVAAVVLGVRAWLSWVGWFD